jgi:response regulator RpfG family c-di-GMP phosphodiesterase
MTEASERRTLLVLDDEPRILSALCRSLRREGYELITSETVEEALRVLDARPVDAILSDQRMPGTSGLQFLEEAARRRPQAVRLLFTGWPEEIPPERLAELGVKALITKPWDDAKLKATLRRALSPAGG